MTVVHPSAIGLDAASICQLRCPSCPTPAGARKAIAPGVLRLRDFKALLAANPLRHIELANFGEIFLNKELPGILAHAHEMGVRMSAAEGTNFNHVSDAALQAVVKYQLRELTCSIDGASQETYGKYRVRGDFARVIRNLERLNALKARYRSRFPRLTWQFVAFGHNEHEILEARAKARKLGMRFYLKLSWDERFSPVRDRDLVARLSGMGVATRSEYLRRHGRHLMRQNCLQLWHRPQFNWDGTSLGCCYNIAAEFGGNLFRDGVEATVNSEKMTYAREMLLGRVPARADVPCTACVIYQILRAQGDWHDEAEILGQRASCAWPGGVAAAARRLARRPRPGYALSMASAQPPRSTLPTVDFCGLTVTRLVLGHNPLAGYSHQGPQRDAAMIAYHTPERILETWERAWNAGINTMVTNNTTPRVVDTVARYLREGGQLQWIAQVSNRTYPSMERGIDRVVEMGCRALFFHGDQIDGLYERRDADTLAAWVQHARQYGVPIGAAGHSPELHDWVAALGLVDFHVVCFFNCGSLHSGRGYTFQLADVGPAVECIRRLEAPCIGYKIMGAGRLDPAMALEHALTHIKPNDIVNVGMHRGDKDGMVEENAAMVRAVLAGRPAAPAPTQPWAGLGDALARLRRLAGPGTAGRVGTPRLGRGGPIAGGAEPSQGSASDRAAAPRPEAKPKRGQPGPRRGGRRVKGRSGD